MRERKNYLDVAKLLAVLSVVYVHSSINYNPVRRTIACFFMPVFFVIYGVASSKRSITSFQEFKFFLLKRVRSLLVPYVLWTIIYAPSVDAHFFKKVVIGNNYALGQADTNSVLWFLPCMFIAVLLFQLYVNIRLKINGRGGRIGWDLSAMILCGIISLWCNPGSPEGRFFGFDIAFSGCLFMIIGGRVLRAAGDYLEKKPFYVKLILGLLLFAAAYVFATWNLPYLEKDECYGVVMALGIYGRYDLFLCGAVLGSLGLFMIAMLFQEVRLFAYMGRFSLFIMAVHYILFNFVKPLCNPIQKMRHGAYLFPVTVTLCCFMICIPLCLVIDWAVPELNGKCGGMKRQEPAAIQNAANKSGVNSLE